MRKIYLQITIILALIGSSNGLQGQVVFNEISSTGEVEIYNMGETIVDMSEWWIYNTPASLRLSVLPILCGSLVLPPKEVVVVDVPTFFDNGSGELVLFSTNSFGNAEALVDYVIWGNRRGFISEDIAVDSMQWIEGDRAPSMLDGQSLQYDRLDNAASSWSAGAPSLCEAVDPCLADSTSILFDNGESSVFICSGNGVADPLNITVEGEIGEAAQWVVTDEDGNVLALPPALPIDLEGAPAGVCLIYHINAVDTVQSLVVGVNIDMLFGCFQISNPLSVIRDGVDGGQLLTPDGLDRLSICIGEGSIDSVDVNLEGEIGDTSVWIVTNSRNIILALPGPPPYSLEASGDTLWKIYSISFNTPVAGLVSGGILDSLKGSCFSLSNPVLVFRNEGTEPTQGGALQTVNGLTELTFCTSDGIPDTFSVTVQGDVGARQSWVITDTAGMILGIPSSQPFNFEGVPTGVCLLWNLRYGPGIMGLDVGANVFNLKGTCFGLSNPITVNRVGLPAGVLQFADSTGELNICAGDGVPDPFSVILTGNGGTDSTWLFTDSDSIVIGVPVQPPFDLDRAGPGTCLVWHIAHNGEVGFIPNGTHINEIGGCIAISNPITVIRQGVAGGTLTLTDSISTTLEICAGDDNPDPFEVIVDGALGSAGLFVITDTSGIILARPSGPIFDLEGAGGGECLLYHIGFDNIDGLAIGNSIDSLDGCYGRSNPILVIRDTSGIVCETVSSRDIELTDPVAVFPNPSFAEFGLVKELGPELSLRVFNLMGQSIFQADWASESQDITIDLGEHAPGTYLLQLRRGSAVSTRRLIRL